MELSYIKKIIRLLENSNVDELEIEEEGKKIRVARNRQSTANFGFPASAPMSYASGAAQHLPAAAESKPAAPTKTEKQYHEVRSPIVGTFYRSPSPDADVYAEVGQQVKAGQVLCIVEAMKLMNEIECDADGTLMQVMVENGKPVEYNQVLFLIDKG
jgi:acetyl-CoA carboxylase biotin carboxyl carrier protein